VSQSHRRPAPLAGDRNSAADWALFLLLGFMWGSAYLFIKIGVQTLTPWTLIASRLGVGVLVLGTVMAVARQPLPREPRVYGHLFVLAVTYIALPFFLITTAEQTVDSSLAAIIQSSVPLFVFVIAAVSLRDEPVTLSRLAGVLVGFAGVVVLVAGGGNVALGSSSFSGELALVGASVAYASAAVYARRFLHGVAPVTTAFMQVFFAFLIAVVFAFVVERPLATVVRPETVLVILWLGALSSGVAYIAFFRLLSRWGATRTALVAYMFPVVGIALGVAVRGEPIDARIIGGTILIVGGVALVNSTAEVRRRLAASRGVPEAPVAD
jgi:drug/metabolite transporter (DMT)-like permease